MQHLGRIMFWRDYCWNHKDVGYCLSHPELGMVQKKQYWVQIFKDKAQEILLYNGIKNEEGKYLYFKKIPKLRNEPAKTIQQ